MIDGEFIGSRWIDTEADDRPVVVLRYGGNGAWFRYEDDGGEWHCFLHDWFVWNRFRRIA